MSEPVMLPSLEGTGAKLGEGMWAMDFQPRHCTNWLLTKWHIIMSKLNRITAQATESFNSTETLKMKYEFSSLSLKLTDVWYYYLRLCLLLQDLQTKTS